ncbi:PH domain-containing protein [Amycolatopsis pithecellobii]|uniref:PH domain-containing protein n=1 Tax=Amycolatopsis pithecellobii TaxID=664692 RepID=UPI0028A76D6D|nr:PH domain-containing protein [Amycolatopsis pithecellobii]
MPETPEPQRQVKRRKATFRVPLIALLAIFGLMVCLAPTAFADVPGLWALYVVPLGLIVFVVRTRTVATPQGLAVRTVFGHRDLPWEALKGLSISKRAKVRAVLTDDSTIPLPSVRTRHLPVLALVSGGRLKDPTGLIDDLVSESPETPKPTE